MILNCVICDNEFKRSGKQALTAKTCSRKCMGELYKAKANTECTNCGESFHIKKSQKERYNRNLGFFCSKDCLNMYKVNAYSGEGNHQYGLKGHLNSSFKGDLIERKNHKNVDIYKYVGYEYEGNQKGRVTLHRYLVQENAYLFGIDNFDLINGQHILKKGLDVHHIDHNHSNNDLDNLQVLTRSEHTSEHNKQKEIIRGDIGRIAGIKVKESIELIESVELSETDRGRGGYGSTGK